MNRELIKYLPRLKHRTLAVVGDVMLDHFIHGSVERVSPEAPVPVLQVESERYTLGGAGNVADNIKAADCDVHLFGVIGRDQAGQHVLDNLNDKRINFEGLHIDEGRVTTVKTRVVAQTQQVARIDRECNGPISRDAEESLMAVFEKNLHKFEAIVISDYCKGVVSPTLARRVIDLASARQIPVIGDTKNRDIGIFRGISIVTPNHKEAKGITGLDNDFDSGRMIREMIDGDVLITQGARGMTLFRHGSEQSYSTAAKEVFDVTGAGDTVAAFLALGMSAKLPLTDAVMLANCAAGIVVGKSGTSRASLDEIAAFIENYE